MPKTNSHVIPTETVATSPRDNTLVSNTTQKTLIPLSIEESRKEDLKKNKNKHLFPRDETAYGKRVLEISEKLNQWAKHRRKHLILESSDDSPITPNIEKNVIHSIFKLLLKNQKKISDAFIFISYFIQIQEDLIENDMGDHPLNPDLFVYGSLIDGIVFWRKHTTDPEKLKYFYNFSFYKILEPQSPSDIELLKEQFENDLPTLELHAKTKRQKTWVADLKAWIKLVETMQLRQSIDKKNSRNEN